MTNDDTAAAAAKDSSTASAGSANPEQQPSVEAEVEEWQAEEMEWWARYYRKASAKAGNEYQMRKARGLRKAAARMLRVSRGYARLARLRREVAATIREIIARNGAGSPSEPSSASGLGGKEPR